MSLIEGLKESAREFERPPSVQSQVNIRAINRMHEAATQLEATQAALRKIANHNSGVPDSHMECENCKDAFLDPYIEVKRIARASLDNSKEGEK